MTRQDAKAFLKGHARTLAWGALLFFTAAGFSLRTPRQELEAQSARISRDSASIDTVKRAQRTDRRQTSENFSALFKLACLDRQESKRGRRDLELAGLNCPKLFAETAVRARQQSTAPDRRP